MKHVNEVELCNKLNEVIDELRNGTIDVKIASEIFNGAGKIIKAKLGKLEYQLLTVKLQGKLAKIPFFEGNVK